MRILTTSVPAPLFLISIFPLFFVLVVGSQIQSKEIQKTATNLQNNTQNADSSLNKSMDSTINPPNPINDRRKVNISIDANAVAWYGAIVATLSLLLSLFVSMRDRAKIFVKATPNVKLASSHFHDPNKEYICIEVFNRGRRPKTIEKVGLKTKNGKYIVDIADLQMKGPQEITEGKSGSWLIDQTNIKLEEIKFIEAIDQTGKRYKGSLKII